jgi:hypothetical protein
MCPSMTSKDANDCVGVIFPILPEHSQRLFEGRKSVFVKYSARENLPRRLQSGSKLFLYQSRSNRGIEVKQESLRSLAQRSKKCL